MHRTHPRDPISRRSIMMLGAVTLTGFVAASASAQELPQASLLAHVAGEGSPEDRLAIWHCLQEYLRVTDERSQTSIAKAFDPAAALMSVSQAGELRVLSQSEWWSRVSRIPTGEINRRSGVRTIDVVGHAAVARIDMVQGTRNSTDFFNLLKMRAGWRIVNKVLSLPIV